MSLDIKVPVPVVVGVGALVLGTWLYFVFSGGGDSGSLVVHYPYWCRDCKAVFDVAELKKDANSWRIPKEAHSDSIVYCVRCNTGWAYPVARCGQCSQRFVLHLQPEPRCPACYPDAKKQADQDKIDLTPPEVKALK